MRRERARARASERVGAREFILNGNPYGRSRALSDGGRGVHGRECGRSRARGEDVGTGGGRE